MIYQFLKSFILLIALIALSSKVMAQLKADTLSGHEQAELDALEKNEQFDRDRIVKQQEKDKNTNYYADLKDSDQDILIRQIDQELGVYLEDYSTTNDHHRFGLSYHLNTDLKSPFEVSTFEANYAYRLGVAWLEFEVSQTSGKYRELTELNSSAGVNSEDQREANAKNLSLGLGLGYRTRYIRSLINSLNLFETTAAYLTYNSFSDDFDSEAYSGHGIKADFGLHKRISSRSHWGGKLSYNLASVTRAEAFEGESTAARSLTITWLTLGLDYSFYF